MAIVNQKDFVLETFVEVDREDLIKIFGEKEEKGEKKEDNSVVMSQNEVNSQNNV